MSDVSISSNIDGVIQIKDDDGNMREVSFKNKSVYLDGKRSELLENFAILLGLNVMNKVVECGCCGTIINDEIDCPHCDTPYW